MSNKNDLLGKIIWINGDYYRFIHQNGTFAILCMLRTSKLQLIYYPLDKLYEECEHNKDIIETEEPYIIDYSKMSEKESIEFEKRKEVIDRISKVYGPSYMGLMGKDKKQVLIDIQQEMNISNVTLWSWIRKYIQSGLNYNSLVDNRYHYKPHKDYNYTKKTGRPTKYNTASGVPLTKEVLEHFEEGLKIIKSGRYRTIKYAYFCIMEKYYSYPSNNGDNSVKLYPESKRPTFNQFYYYCKKNFKAYEKEIVKTSKMEFNNNSRLRLGSSRAMAYRPGIICEVDANEVDISIVSELDTTQCIGRPIIYVMIDNCTSMILAVSVGFENNSFIGITNLMLNLAADKLEYTKQYGITIQDNMWYSNIIPDCIRCDRGSEFASDKFGKVCNNLGIKRDLVPPGTGSMKGIIEEYFNEFQLSIKPYIEGKGLITKRHDSNHHKEAMLTMYDFTRLLINHVITHNQKTLLNYYLTKDMLKIKNFNPNPITLWEYFCNNYNEPKYITNANKIQYFYDVMIERKASISGQGLRLDNLVYINENDEKLKELMLDANKHRKKFVVRCDPRSVDEIYYMRNEKLYIAKLNPDLPNVISYKGLSWIQYEEYNTKRNDTKIEGKKNNELLEFQEHQVKNFVINSIERNEYANTKNINASRKKEKELDNYNNRISNKLPKNEPDRIIQAEKINKTVIKQDETNILEQDNTENINVNTSEPVTQSYVVKKDDEFKPMEDLRAALEEHENKGRD